MVAEPPKKPPAPLFSADLFGYRAWMPESASAGKNHTKISVMFWRLRSSLSKDFESLENDMLRDIEFASCPTMYHQTVPNWAGSGTSLTHLHFATNVGQYRSGVELLREKPLEAKTRSRTPDEPAQFLVLKTEEAK